MEYSIEVYLEKKITTEKKHLADQMFKNFTLVAHEPFLIYTLHFLQSILSHFLSSLQSK